MKKVYIDRSENNECISLFSHDLETVRAGTTITSMPQSDYCEEYKRFADEYDINFIFDNYVPAIDFYTVPQFDICAMDSEGGYIGTIGNSSDFELDYPIGYIDKDRNCFIIASCGKEFLENVANWKARKQSYNDISFFESKEDAQNKLEFIDITKANKKCLSKQNQIRLAGLSRRQKSKAPKPQIKSKESTPLTSV